jgi:uncharacterized lipoprotein YajG
MDTMKTQLVLFALTAMLMNAGCSSQPKTEVAPAPAASAPETSVPAPAPSTEAPKTDVAACEGKAAKDACSYTGDKGEVKGVCVRNETYALQCQAKKGKKK